MQKNAVIFLYHIFHFFISKSSIDIIIYNAFIFTSSPNISAKRLFPSYHNSNIKQSLLLCQQKIFDALELKLGMLNYEKLLTEIYTLPPSRQMCKLSSYHMLILINQK